MLPPLIRRPVRSRNGESRSKERGFTMALVALSIVMIISMAALSIDIGTLYEAKAEAQRSADAAALTAARVISISGATGSNGTDLGQICGGPTSTATQAATSMAQQNLIGGIAAGTVTVKYGAGTAGATNSSCTGIANFAVNPIVTASVQRTNLPVFFARIFSLFGSTYSGTTVSATATAEAFNPSGSDPMVPVDPRCVKPWFVPNQDPGNVAKPFVLETTGALQNAGVATAGDIGETFNLVVDCNASARRGRTPGTCTVSNPPQATTGANPTLDYLPGQVLNASLAIAANGGINACSDATNNDYSEAIAGCDQSTKYQCGVVGQNTVDLAEDPGPSRNDSVNGAECLINASGDGLGNGQDSLAAPGAPPPYSYPFQIQAGSNNAQVALGSVPNGSQVTNSPSIVSLPIYDSAAVTTFTARGMTAVTVIGFLQVFINYANSTNGQINVTVMNVSGCGNAATGSPVTGTSPVPIRLITPP